MAYDLVATAGPVEGERFPLDTSEEETIIGRTRNGINLPDPLVSVRHAKLQHVKGGWQITDLGSATGTRVNGTPLDPDRPMPIELGDTVRIGECEFLLDSSGSRVLKRMAWAIIPAWLLVIASFVVLFWVSGERPVTLNWTEPIRTTEGASKVLVIPSSFIREHALDISSMKLRRITDFDGNAIDELWLYVGKDELVVTFTESGWDLLGQLPKGCVDRQAGGKFPDLTCDGLDFRMYPEGYVAISQVDPVVWLVGEARDAQQDGPTPSMEPEPEAEPAGKKGKKKRKKKSKAAPEPISVPTEVPELAALNGAAGPVPFRIAMGSIDKLAGFLAQHGVTQPVHYVICEGAFPGVPAQAVLTDGTVQRFSYGCEQEAVFAGDRSGALNDTRIAAFALTEVGREMLSKHLAYTWSGTPQGMFLAGEKRRTLAETAKWPIPVRGGVYLTFEASEHVFTPIATNPQLDDRVRLESVEAVDLDGQIATLLSRGTVKMDPEGCSELKVTARRWRCAWMRGCFPRASFLTIEEVGCGKNETLLSIGYSQGQYRAANEHVEVRVEVLTQDRGIGVTDVIQARVGVRPAP